jgi:hypothetical protein
MAATATARRVPGRHRTPRPRPEGPGAHRGEPSRAERQAQAGRDRGQRQQASRRRQNARTAVRAPGRVAAGVTVRKGGQHALMAEFLLFCGIAGMRAVADYVPGGQGTAAEGTSKGTVTPRSGQPGPVAVLAAGFVIFFILSFLAARGGTWARVAGLAGLIIDVVLLMNSLPELETVSGAFGNVRAQAQDNAASGPNNVGSAPTPTGA